MLGASHGSAASCSESEAAFPVVDVGMTAKRKKMTKIRRPQLQRKRKIRCSTTARNSQPFEDNFVIREPYGDVELSSEFQILRSAKANFCRFHRRSIEYVIRKEIEESSAGLMGWAFADISQEGSDTRSHCPPWKNERVHFCDVSAVSSRCRVGVVGPKSRLNKMGTRENETDHDFDVLGEADLQSPRVEFDMECHLAGQSIELAGDGSDQSLMSQAADSPSDRKPDVPELIVRGDSLKSQAADSPSDRTLDVPASCPPSSTFTPPPPPITALFEQPLQPLPEQSHTTTTTATKASITPLFEQPLQPLPEQPHTTTTTATTTSPITTSTTSPSPAAIRQVVRTVMKSADEMTNAGVFARLQKELGKLDSSMPTTTPTVSVLEAPRTNRFMRRSRKCCAALVLHSKCNCDGCDVDDSSWASDNYNGGEPDPMSSSDDADEDPQLSDVLDSWDVWEGPCLCVAEQRGLLCSSAKCRNEPFIGALQDPGVGKEESEDPSPTPFQSYTILAPGLANHVFPAVPGELISNSSSGSSPSAFCQPKSSSAKTVSFADLFGQDAFIGEGIADRVHMFREVQTHLLMPAGEIKWEKITLIVDSGASDTVVPPSVCAGALLHHTAKVGIEYEIANGGTLENLGERRCLLKTSETDTLESAFAMAFQVVDVNKALLSVHKVCEQGHSVLFEKDRGAILVGGDAENRIEFRTVGGTYELDVWLKPTDESFARPS